MSKISKYTTALGAFAVFMLPVVTFAQNNSSGSGTTVNTISGGIGWLLKLMQDIVPVILGIAIILFLWGLLKFIMASDEAGRKEGRSFMIWGIIILFVMVSVWGLVNILVGGVFGSDEARIKPIPGPGIIPATTN